ncbi:MAG TPA: gluconate 2-dehydrogenase subunit 3 family protein [Steroidobacteraceae bacterium]|nr:gluconate 2-dehydrogenase subunit 3 family protein [Steroidobacteraceae bacterium]
MSDHDTSRMTRRMVLQGATLVGAMAVAAPTQLQAANVPLKTLTAAEGELLGAILDRLIPTDANGPGARDVGVLQYIDGALGDALKASRSAYSAGLTALDRYARASRGQPFLQLSATDQDSVLIDCETGGATGFTGSSGQFFGMVLNHTRQGMFGDPHYGGNENFVGWDLIAYPGVRTSITAADQKALEANQLKPVRRSAYDYNGFTKADGAHHG